MLHACLLDFLKLYAKMNDVNKANASNSKTNNAKFKEKSSVSKASSSLHINLLSNTYNNETSTSSSHHKDLETHLLKDLFKQAEIDHLRSHVHMNS